MTSFEPVEKMSKDIKQAGERLTPDQARFIVDSYYIAQEDRIRAENQVRALSESNEPNETLVYFSKQKRTLENYMKAVLGAYANAQAIGLWMQDIKGVGPVLSAGLIAHIDIEKAETAGAIWRYAGYDPSVEWNKKEKRPWNAQLKTLCWKIGESFVKVSGKEDAFYGQLYKARKEFELAENEAGKYAEQAKKKLEKYKITKTTDAYKWYIQGKLPPAHIHARAKRYAVKMFLSHLHEVWRDMEGYPNVKPWAIEHGGHAHYMPPPNFSRYH